MSSPNPAAPAVAPIATTTVAPSGAAGAASLAATANSSSSSSNTTVRSALDHVHVHVSPRNHKKDDEFVPHRCIMCDVVEKSSADIQAHLLQQHCIVIADCHKIALFPLYLTHWKESLKTKPLKDVASQIVAPIDGKSQTYYLISDILPEDREIRQQLQTQLLNEMLELQQEERSNVNAVRQCLFCRVAPRGRDALFEHMRELHGFNIGQPDNIVGIDRLLTILRSKLDGLQCIFCERIFKDYTVLRVHMKKKRHFKISSHNKLYDQFYLVNYLEWGKNWEDIAREPDLDQDDDDDDNNDDNDTDDKHHHDDDASGSSSQHRHSKDLEDDDDKSSKHGGTTSSIGDADDDDTWLESGSELDAADEEKMRFEWQLDEYAMIKFINYMRRCVLRRTCSKCRATFESTSQLFAHYASSAHFGVNRDATDWRDDSYLQPVVVDDPMLCCARVIGGADDDQDFEHDPEFERERDEAMRRRQELMALGAQFADN